MAALRGIFVATAVLLARGAVADVRVDLLGQWGGSTHAIKVRNNIAYVGIGPRLVVLDVHDRTHPVRLGQTEPLGYYVTDIAIQGALAYVATHQGGFKIIHIADPAHPRLLSSWTFYPYYSSVEAVAVQGDYAFVLLQDSGLHVFDVSNPAAPQQIATYEFNGPGLDEANDMAIAGDTAYVITWDYFALLDISDPFDPRLISIAPIGVHPRQIEVEGNYAYIADSGPGALKVVDVSNPQAPQLVAQLGTESYVDGWALGLGDGRVYLHNDVNNYALSVIDRTDPTQPVWRGSAPMITPLTGAVAVVGTDVLACDWYGAVRVIDAADADYPLEIGQYDDLAHSLWINAADGRVFSGGYTPGTQVLDSSNPAALSRIAEWFDPLGREMLTFRVEVHDDIAYLAQAQRGPGTDREFVTLDISHPTAPRRLGTLELQNVAMSFVLREPYAYIAINGGGLLVVDISNPADPIPLNAGDTSRAFDVILRNDLAFVANFDHGLQVYSLTDPASPQLLSETPEMGAARGVTLIDDVAYVCGNWGVFVIDVSDPAAPVILQRLLPQALIERIAADGRLVLVPAGRGLQVIDATEPRHPRLIGEYDSNGRPNGIAVADGLVFLANWEGGVEIVEVHQPGDLDGDDYVGIFDLTGLLSSFGLCAADVAYNRYADFDGDECVTVQDLAALLATFGG